MPPGRFPKRACPLPFPLANALALTRGKGSLRLTRRSVALWIIAFSAGVAYAQGVSDRAMDDALPRIPPREPLEALETFRIRHGFRMELVAAEPLVTDPVDLAYDANGRGWVVEMRDYPYTDKARHRAWQENPHDRSIGRVRILEDLDGDGRMDRATTFADGLSWPTGVALWKGGAFVLATPDIWYLEDTTGDLRADLRRRVFTGFRKYNVQAVINNPRFGLDHRFVVAGSTNGGEIVPGDGPDAEPVRLGRNDFTFDPVTGRFEVVSGGARFGNTFDDRGNRFISNIRNPIIHLVLPDRYLARNRWLPVRSAAHDVAVSGDSVPVYRESPPEPWRVVRARRWASVNDRAYPRSETVPDGFFTSAAGLTIYRGSAYPEEFYGNAFVGEVANNLVHRQVLEPDGVTFSGRRADEGVEFLASTDTWFRPVNFVNAPDGTLHVVDMYRETIEHPWSIPDDIHERLDLESGRDRGRIWRLLPPGGVRPPESPRLAEASTAKLASLLEHGSSWWREAAHRLLYERQDLDAVAPLRRLLAESPSATARLRALWSLRGLDALREEDIARGLEDGSASVREHAVRLAETLLEGSSTLVERVLDLAGDPGARVRFQVAFSLGETSDPQATEGLARIARRDGESEWIRTAVLSSATATSRDLLLRLVKDGDREAPSPDLEFLRQLASVTGARNGPEGIARVLEEVASRGRSPALQNAVVLGLAEGLERAGESIASVTRDPSAPSGSLIHRVLEGAALTAADETVDVPLRERAVRLLRYRTFADARAPLESLLDPEEPRTIQIAAIRALADFGEPDVAELLLASWQGFTPAVREAALDALVARRERIGVLLLAIEEGRVPKAHVGLLRRARLLRHRDGSVRGRAKELFGRGGDGSRSDVVERYREALDVEGDRERGLRVFEENCAACHRAAGRGNAVGPDIATVRHRCADELLLHILDPNREVSPEYVQYDLVLEDGRTVAGIIAAETASSITLKLADGADETVLRERITTIRGSEMSLMPEGLEANIPVRTMADLLAFLQAE